MIRPHRITTAHATIDTIPAARAAAGGRGPHPNLATALGEQVVEQRIQPREARADILMRKYVF